MKVMSFNASFEAMLGKENLNPGRYRILNKYKYSNKRSYKGKIYEHGNIPNILDIRDSFELEHDYENFDFIAIQEANCFSDYKLDKKCSNEFVFKDSFILESMNIYTYKEGMDYLITLYSKKFSKPQILTGYIIQGKPYMILLFEKEKILFINVHNEYGNGVENMKNTLNEVLKPIEDLSSYTIVLVGDINDTIHEIEIQDIKLKEPSTFHTCCYTTDGEKLVDELETFNRQYDHIFSNKKIKEYKAFDIFSDNGEIISDHKPIKCVI